MEQVATSRLSEKDPPHYHSLSLPITVSGVIGVGPVLAPAPSNPLAAISTYSGTTCGQSHLMLRPRMAAKRKCSGTNKDLLVAVNLQRACARGLQ